MAYAGLCLGSLRWDNGFPPHIGYQPFKQKMLAEERLRLIQDYTEFVRLESRRLGKKFRKSKAVREFCGEEGISPATLYRYIQRYQQGGGEALVSKYGLRKGKGPVVEKILPLLKEALEPGKGYSGNLVKLAQICSERGVEVPNLSLIHI